MSNKYMLKWYSFKKASQYLLFLGLVAGFTQVEELRAAPTVQSRCPADHYSERNHT